MSEHKVPGDRLRPGYVYLVDRHEGGGYFRDSSIHEGGAWRPDCQVMVRHPSKPIGEQGLRVLSITGFRGEYGSALDTGGRGRQPDGLSVPELAPSPRGHGRRDQDRGRGSRIPRQAL